MLPRWHPTATRQIYLLRPGKKWASGSGNAKYLFHTTEMVTRWPRYASPPHMTLNPFTGELRQHIPFDRAAYSVRSSRVDAMRFVYQIEHWGKASVVGKYPEVWYQNVAELISWFIENMEVPAEFADFSHMKWGQFAAQRMYYPPVDKFSGIIGHGHVGRGIDSHWDPGNLDTARLEAMLAPAPPPPPDPTPPPTPPNMGAHMSYADMQPTEVWAAKLSAQDIDRMYDLGIQQPDTEHERNYYKNLLAKPKSKEWENFRIIASTRYPLYQPQ